MTDRYAVIGNPIAHTKSPAPRAQCVQGMRDDVCPVIDILCSA